MIMEDSSAKALKLKLEQLELDALADEFLESEQSCGSSSQNDARSLTHSWVSEIFSSEQPEDAADLAALFSEAVPNWSEVQRFKSRVKVARSHSKVRRTLSRIFKGADLKERLRAAIPIPTEEGLIDWNQLHEAISTEEIFAVEQDDESETALNSALESPNTPGVPAKYSSDEVSSSENGSRRLSSSWTDSPGGIGAAVTPGGSLMVNSGGKVFFCMFAPILSLNESETSTNYTSISESSLIMKKEVSTALGSGKLFETRTQITSTSKFKPDEHLVLWHSSNNPLSEGCMVLKFTSSRLLCQSEQFAAELAKYLGVAVPDCRIIRKTDDEWRQIVAAADKLGPVGKELANELSKKSCLLAMEYIPSKGLLNSRQSFNQLHFEQTFTDLGRLFALDMLLGNSDRLQCRALGWRGNPDNILAAKAGRWQERMVVIDAIVQRRPPGALLSKEDAQCEKLAELTLNDEDVALDTLRDAVGSCPAAAEVLEGNSKHIAIKAFQMGLRDGLNAVMELKGLLEMMFEVISAWIHEFLKDIEGSNAPNIMPRPIFLELNKRCATTMAIRRINEVAEENHIMKEKVTEWKEILKERGKELREAMEEWQIKRGRTSDDGMINVQKFPTDGFSSLCKSWDSPHSYGNARLTTGFLDGHHPIVDVYELKVRLEHMIQRLRSLQEAMATARPTKLLSGLYVSGAVEASSLHLLHYLGITHVLNATEDLLLPEDSHNFSKIRIPLKDLEEENVEQYFETACDFIDNAIEQKGAVLVHCHAGQSRSCCLVLSWLMTRRQWTLRTALDFLYKFRPQAALNAGYMAALLRLEERLFGTQTVKVKKTKPPLKSCPVCGDKIGLSEETVKLHLRLKHHGYRGMYSLSSSDEVFVVNACSPTF